MSRTGGWILGAVLTGAVLSAPGTPHAEVIEEIVAWVNGEIITKSDLDQEEQSLLAEAYRRFTGTELDEQVRRVRAELLGRMIDRRILYQRAARMFDISKVEKNLLDSFKEQNKFESDAALESALAQEGMTLAELKRRLTEMYAPEEIIRLEVAGRIAVSDKEIAAYYESHPELSEQPAKATVREIVLLADTVEARAARRPEAEAIRERLRQPEADFAAVASEVSESPTKASGGLIGSVGRGDLAGPLDEEAFRLPVGEVSAVLEMPHGLHLIKVDERVEASRRPLAELKDGIRRKIEDEKYAAALAEYLKKARSESEILVNDKYKNRFQQPSGS